MTKKNVSKTKKMSTKEKSVKKTSPGRENSKTGKGMEQAGKKTGSVRNSGNLNPKEKNRENKKDVQESRSVFGDHGQSPRNERIYPGKKGSSKLMNDFKLEEEGMEEEVPLFEEKDMTEEREEYRSNFPEFRNKPNQEFRR